MSMGLIASIVLFVVIVGAAGVTGDLLAGIAILIVIAVFLLAISGNRGPLR